MSVSKAACPTCGVQRVTVFECPDCDANASNLSQPEPLVKAEAPAFSSAEGAAHAEALPSEVCPPCLGDRAQGVHLDGCEAADCDAAADEELPPHPQVLRPAKIHVLKCWPAYFEAMRVGRKSFEVRRNDRDFQVGDCIVVQEYNPELGRLSGEAFSVRVVYMLAGGQFGVSEGYCVMGVEPWVASRPYTAGCPESCASRQALAEHLAACEARGADVDPSLDYDRENPERPAHCCPTEALSHFESCPVWTELATLRKVAEAALALRHSGYDGPLLGDEVAPLFAALAELDSKEKST